MKKSRKFISMPIVSLGEGIQIGTVRSLIVDSAKMEIAAIFIDQRGWFREQKIIPYSKVRSIGNDAITIDQSSNAQRSISLPEILRLIKERTNPIGTRVVAENGTVLGLVDEYIIDEQSGKIISLEISGKFLESLFTGKALLSTEYVRTMGSDIIVAKEGAEANLEKLDGGLQETISNIKEGTSTLWESTLQRTKEISKNIKEKYDKKETKTEINQIPLTEEPTSILACKHAESTEPTIEPDTSLNVVSEVEINPEEILPGVINLQPNLILTTEISEPIENYFEGSESRK